MKSKTFNVKTFNSKDSKSQVITFEGDLSIKNAIGIKKAVQDVKFNNDSVTIYLKKVEKIDITSVQIFWDLRVALKKEGKKTTMISEIPQDIERLLKNAGFDKTL